MFAASSENLKVSFEKLQSQLCCPIESTLVDATGPACSTPQHVSLVDISQLSKRAHQHQPRQKECTQQQPIDTSYLSTFSTLSLAEAASSQHPSGSDIHRVDEKKARIAAIIYAKRASQPPDAVCSPAPAHDLTTLSKQPIVSIVTSQQLPVVVAGPSLPAVMQSSPRERGGRLPPRSAHIVLSNAPALDAISNTAAAQTKSAVSLLTLATAIDMDKCEVESEMNMYQSSSQPQNLATAMIVDDKQTRWRQHSQSNVSELEKQLKEATVKNASLQKEMDTVLAEKAAIVLELRAAQATILQFSKPTANASVGYDAIPLDDDGEDSCFSLADCIAESQLLLNMAEEGLIEMRHRNQLLFDRFYEREARKLHRILMSLQKRRVTFKSQMNVGEFCIDDPPDLVSSAKKFVHESKFDVADKSQKRRKKCEGQIKWLHAEAQALCRSSHAICTSAHGPPSIVPTELSSKGKLISSSNLHSWFLVASSCTKFELNAPSRFPQLVSSQNSLTVDHAAVGLCSLDATSGGLSYSSMCQLCFALRGCSTLKSVDFSLNPVSEFVAAALGSLMATACIARLRLSSCDIASSHISRMQLAVPWLTELDVSNNDIRDDGFVSLIVCLQVESCSLKKLNCANNALSSLSCKMLCPVLDLNSSLRSLILDDNVSCLFCFHHLADFFKFSCSIRFWRKVCSTFSIRLVMLR